MLTYKDTIKGIAVLLDNKLTGYIVAQSKGFMYIPVRYKKFTHVYSDLPSLKKDLESK